MGNHLNNKVKFAVANLKSIKLNNVELTLHFEKVSVDLKSLSMC